MLDSIVNYSSSSSSSSWWLTPTYLFLFINLVIATIAISTRFTNSQRKHQLARVPSLIDRVKSFNFSLYKNSDDDPTTDHHFQPPTKLARVPSFLDRLNFSHYKFPSNNVDTEFAAREKENRVDTPLARVPSLLDRFSLNKSASNNVHSTEFVEPELENRVDSYDSSLLDRVKSNISLYLSSDSNNRTESEPEDYSDMGHRVHMRRTKSDYNEISSEIKSPPEKMKKSASEKFESWNKEDDVERRRPQTVKVEKTTPFGDVDVKADDFINKFKQQLKLQRLDSLLRYRGK